MAKKVLVIWITVVSVVIIGGFLIIRYQLGPGALDSFAKCLENSGASFYGAFWCPHCQNQKKLFGKSAKFLPYIECSTQDSRGQLKVCKDKNIEGYPTWEFSDGSKESGELSLTRLADKTGCQLPQ